MIPAAFDYVRARSVEEVVELLAKHGDDAKLLAGGHSLLPAMKLRLAQPRLLIDIGRVPGLSGIREEDGRIAVGALTTHHEIESSEILAERCPLMPETASTIGDVQVRNRGTLGGNLAHADPASDWPAAILALEAEIEAVGPSGRRTIAARDFFVDLMQSALAPGELLVAVRVPATGRGVAYEKFAQQASGFALAGAAVAIVDGAARVALTGVAPTPYRATAVEAALAKLSPASIDAASERAADGIDPLRDLHGSPEYRAHLARVLTRRALRRAAVNA